MFNFEGNVEARYVREGDTLILGDVGRVVTGFSVSGGRFVTHTFEGGHSVKEVCARVSAVEAPDSLTFAERYRAWR